MELSDRGALLIANFEGFRSHPYRDAVGVWTIGYGSTKGVGPNSPPVTKAQALTRLRREASATYGKAVNDLRLPLNQNQFDALTSFAYNLGPGIFAPSNQIGKHLRARAWGRAADAILLYDKAGNPPKALLGLTRRRRAERSLFLTPVENHLTPWERKQIDKLFYHRRGMRKHKSGPKYNKHLGWARWHKEQLRLRANVLLTRGKRDGWKKRNRGVRQKTIRDIINDPTRTN